MNRTFFTLAFAASGGIAGVCIIALIERGQYFRADVLMAATFAGAFFCGWVRGQLERQAEIDAQQGDKP